MFNWRDFFGYVSTFFALIGIAALIATGLYEMCEMGRAWGYALVVGGIALGGSIAVGFGL